ncbi:LPS O-antigen length regulator [Providencia stuartii]|uniref:LPS O-antigen length regulator n=2 Tax=Providencia TaxID=586 RepID=A0AAI9DAS6_PROST|nr:MULTISPECIES: LPS O-antigen length regulator Wzz(fepE) [Providencia]MDV5226832.1 LPS O-antigen length regulator Wzz(fepE) [Providencia rettgeri]ELR5112161.1 LPS O-antigen length regulator [Providencia stuartii]ELR5299603.1 LPS O-antigen length regulator [Providencia stuartii]MDW7588626.1 LPS O-antigen length regulator Wzz(fepE) [Providencia sp. 2023EL-00965]MDX4944829.1 LPS O-antigen length regulator Wzz(fepE) [Providencia manganoxydans]
MSTDKESQDGKTAAKIQVPQFNMQQSDEIDLMALFAVLVRNKLLIIAITVVITLISALVVTQLPQKWSSTAVIIPPSSEEIKDINTLGAQLTVLDVKIDLSASRIFSAFVDQYRSKVNQEAYVRSTEYYKKLAEQVDPADKENGDQRLVNTIIANSIQIQDQSKEKNSTSTDIVLTFTAPQPSEAQDLLAGYVRYTATKVREQFKLDIQNAIARQLVFANETFKQEVTKIRTEYDVKVERLKRAIDIAKAAGVRKPIVTDSAIISDDPDYPIALGTEALEKKLAIELQNRDIALLSEDLQIRQHYIKNLSELDIDTIEFMPIKFILAPDLPTKKDSPKSALIVALSAILAMILSCSYVLTRELYRDFKKNNTLTK